MLLMMLPSSIVAQDYTRSGNTFTMTSTKKAKSEPTKTKFTVEKDGKSYPVYMGSTGSCFILKISSKTGKEYRNYLGPELSATICKELGVEYEPKTKSR
jgi:ribosomal protein L31